VKVGDLVDVNQVRGAGSYKHVIPRGLGVVVRLEETEPAMYGTGQTEGFDQKSVKVVND
jgi:hypothetical protein